MPITPFSATYDTPLREMARLLTQSPLKGKEGNEVLWSLDAIQVWRDWFATRYGELTQINHHSNPDDPPDLDAVFAKGRLGIEHTTLLPHPLGFAESIAQKVNPAGGRLLPSLSRKWSREELQKLAIPMASSAHWADIEDEHQAAFTELASAVRQKAKEPASHVICITDKVTIADAYTEWLASDLHNAVNSDEFVNLGDRTVIFHHRDNDLQFFSALIRRGDPLLARRDGMPIVPRASLSF